MVTRLYILISVLTVVIVRASTLQPCPDGKCGNITIFLGVRFGSKVIRYPIYPDGKGLNDGEDKSVSDTITNNSTMNSTDNNILGRERDYVTFRAYSNSFNTTHLWPHHRPIPRGNEIQINYTERDNAQFTYTTIETASINRSDLIRALGWKYYERFGKTTNLFQVPTLNLTAIGITGEDLKKFFESLSERSRGTTKQVKRLFLNRNDIRHLPVAVFPVDMEYGLEELTLNDNPLQFLHSQSCFELSRLRNLKILNLSRTSLYSLQYLYLSNLEVLDLSGNYLSSVPPTLENLHNLRKLDLNGNRLTTLEESPISSLRNLEMLSLANNGLRSVYGEPFKSLYYLKEVYLNNNNFKEIAPLDKVHLPTILHLRDNPFECSCPLLATFHKQTPIIYDREQLRCTVGDKNTPLLLGSTSEREVHKICPGRWDWFLDRGEDLENVARWFRRRGVNQSVVVDVLWWLSLGVVAVAGTLVIRRYYRRRVVNTVPYNVMYDEKMPLCVDNIHSYPRLLIFMSHQDVHIGCGPSKWAWIKGRSEDVFRWISRHGLYIGASRLLWWVLLVITVVVVLTVLRRCRKKIAEEKDKVKVPYNVLDDNMIVA